MGKHDHIPELLGTENYIGWATKMQYALASEDYWCHVNTKAELVLPQSSSEPRFEPEPFRTGRMVRSKVRPRLRTEPLQRFRVRLTVKRFWKKCQYKNKWMMSSRWVNSNICKDPFLFLFNDILVIAKPHPEDSDTFLEVTKPNPADRKYQECGFADNSSSPASVRSRVQEPSQEPLRCKHSSSSFQQTQIMQSHRSSSILQSIHILERGNHGVTPLDVLLESFTNWWYEANPVHISYDKDLAYHFGRAIVQLNDVLHGAISHEYRQG
ncbi:hypothetical protein EV702DRAFT_1248851 [Suillus placidus]|uniref:Uncharacterized protein n=1 Tax=Suillus placidus TaxID=48579 RepID=A0A9P6ZL44_9AGAM|nr:hypothetical protein EV702DRAFT_1248851 [Suillus placidus]